MVYGANERESKEDDCLPVIVAVQTSSASSAQEGAQQPSQPQEGAPHSSRGTTQASRKRNASQSSSSSAQEGAQQPQLVQEGVQLHVQPREDTPANVELPYPWVTGDGPWTRDGDPPFVMRFGKRLINPARWELLRIQRQHRSQDRHNSSTSVCEASESGGVRITQTSPYYGTLVTEYLPDENTDDDDSFEGNNDDSSVSHRVLRSYHTPTPDGPSIASHVNAVRHFANGLFIAPSYAGRNAGLGLFTAFEIKDNHCICAYEGHNTDDCNYEVNHGHKEIYISYGPKYWSVFHDECQEDDHDELLASIYQSYGTTVMDNYFSEIEHGSMWQGPIILDTDHLHDNPFSSLMEPHSPSPHIPFHSTLTATAPDSEGEEDTDEDDSDGDT